MDSFVYTFDASISIETDTANDPEGAAELLLETASENDLAVSLCTEGTLNVKALQDKLDAAEKQLRALLFQPLAVRDHMTSCDRIMGATHRCTCHADEYRALLERL